MPWCEMMLSHCRVTLGCLKGKISSPIWNGDCQRNGWKGPLLVHDILQPIIVRKMISRCCCCCCNCIRNFVSLSHSLVITSMISFWRLGYQMPSPGRAWLLAPNGLGDGQGHWWWQGQRPPTKNCGWENTDIWHVIMRMACCWQIFYIVLYRCLVCC